MSILPSLHSSRGLALEAMAERAGAGQLQRHSPSRCAISARALPESLPRFSPFARRRIVRRGRAQRRTPPRNGPQQGQLAGLRRAGKRCYGTADRNDLQYLDLFSKEVCLNCERLTK